MPPRPREKRFAPPDPLQDPGLDRAARELLASSEVIDLHVETYLPVRLFGYDISRSHRSWNPGYCVGHLDLPGIRAGGLDGAMWSITSNVFLPARARWSAFLKNVHDLELLLFQNHVRTAVDYADYRRKRKAGGHVALLCVQGGNVCEAAPVGALDLPDSIVRVTLLHMTNSVYGAPSTPLSRLRSYPGLTVAGRECVERLNAKRVFVDLAHIHPRGFYDAVDAHARDLPLIVTHTGVRGVKSHWRNLDDDQIRIVAASGGVIGVIFSDIFLRPRGRSQPESRGAGIVLDHLEHIIRVAGEDAPALGGDLDGMIIPPPGLRDGRAYGRLVSLMLKRGWSETRIRKILGLNFLRALRMLRPGI